MKCNNCGCEIPDISRFCKYCGREVKSQSDISKTNVINSNQIGKSEPVGSHNKFFSPNRLSTTFCKVLIIPLVLIVVCVALVFGTYRISWHEAAEYNFTGAKKWLLFPNVTEVIDPGYNDYLEAGLKYEKLSNLNRQSAFVGVEYTINDSELSERELCKKAQNLINLADYSLAIETINPLADDNYGNARSIRNDARVLQAEELLKSGEYYSSAYFLLKDAIDEGDQRAQDIFNSNLEDAYNWGIDRYRNSWGSDMTAFYELLVPYKDSFKYARLSYLSEILNDPENIKLSDDLYNELISYLGFEDAGQIVFYNNNTALKFLNGIFTSDEGKIEATFTAPLSGAIDGKRNSIKCTIKCIPDKQWEFTPPYGVLVGGTTTLRMNAKSVNEIEAYLYPIGDTIVLTREK